MAVWRALGKRLKRGIVEKTGGGRASEEERRGGL